MDARVLLPPLLEKGNTTPIPSLRGMTPVVSSRSEERL